MAVLVILVVFVNVPLILLTPSDCVTPPVKPVPVGVDQVYVVAAGTIPLVTLVGVIAKITPLQVVVLIGVMDATGLIFIVTLNTVPIQLPEVGVSKYVAVTVELVVLFNSPLILLVPTACDNPPVKPEPVGAVHVYVVPAGTIPLVTFIGV